MSEFSIIVPIYNVEKYIKTCVESVLSQSFRDFELILVDDGSPDNCGKICDNYKEKDSRVIVVHKENGGLSSARNAGLDIANGAYIIFLDSDDYWDDNDALLEFKTRISETKADLLIFPAKRFYEESNRFTYTINIKVEREKINNADTEAAIEYLIKNNIYRAAAWNKVVKKTIIDYNQMRFKEGYLSEDMDWCGDLLTYCSRFDYYEKPLYVYRQQRAGSITSRKSEKLIADKLYMCKKGYEQSLKMVDKKKSQCIAGYYAYEYSVLLGVSSGVHNKELIRDIKNMRFLLTFDMCDKVKKVHKLEHIVGFSLTRLLLILFVKIKS